MSKCFATGRLHAFRAFLRREMRTIRTFRRKAPPVHFSSGEKLSLVVLLLLLLMGMLIGGYLFASYKGEIWDV